MSRLTCALVFAAVCCPSTAGLAKTNKLFLNFDGDPSAVVFGPLKKFDAHDLNSSWGAAETSQLRGGILAEVARDYREFDVDVTDVQPSGGGLYYTVGIEGTKNLDDGGTFGSSYFDAATSRVYGATNSLFAEFQGATATIKRFR